MAVEYVAFLFCKIYGFDPVDIYPCVEIYVPEMVIADFTGYFSCVAVSVRQHYVIEIYSEIVYMERSFYGISDIRVSYFQVCVIDAGVAAADVKVVQRSLGCDISRYMSADISENIFKERSDESDVYAVQPGGHFQTVERWGVVSAEIHRLLAVDIVGKQDVEPFVILVPAACYRYVADFCPSDAGGVADEVYEQSSLGGRGGYHRLACGFAFQVEILLDQIVEYRQVKAVHIYGQGVALVLGHSSDRKSVV